MFAIFMQSGSGEVPRLAVAATAEFIPARLARLVELDASESQPWLDEGLLLEARRDLGLDLNDPVDRAIWWVGDERSAGHLRRYLDDPTGSFISSMHSEGSLTIARLDMPTDRIVDLWSGDVTS